MPDLDTNEFFDWLNIVDNAIKERYETIQLNGAVLIDGHHIFINVISSIDRYHRNPTKFTDLFSKTVEGRERKLKLLEGSNVISYDPKRVARIYGEITYRIVDYAENNIVSRLSNFEKTPVSISVIQSALNLEEGEFPTDNHFDEVFATYSPNEFILVKGSEERWIFDALMPDFDQVFQNLSRDYQSWTKSKHKRKIESLRRYLDELEKGNWGYFKNQIDGSVTVPYTLKNEALEILKKDWVFGGFNLSTQTRIIDGRKGYVENREKGVDTKLVIKGCELSARNELDWICLVTSDGDHGPLLEHISESGKEVFLSSLGMPSRALTNALKSNDNYFSIAEIFDCIEFTKRVDPRERGEDEAAIDWKVFMLAWEDWAEEYVQSSMKDKGFGVPDSIYSDADLT